MKIHDLNDLIGMECVHNFSNDISEWTDENTVKCKITNTEIEIDSFPHNLTIEIGIIPIEENNISDAQLLEMQLGVSIDSLIFPDYAG